jgi:hypothetical protein
MQAPAVLAEPDGAGGAIAEGRALAQACRSGKWGCTVHGHGMS